MQVLLFLEQVGLRILSLESVHYFGTSEYLSEGFDGEAIHWSGNVNFQCMKMSLVITMHYIFGND